MEFVDEITEVTPRVFLGSAACAKDKELLVSLGITHILNVGNDTPNYHAQDFVYKKLNIVDGAVSNMGMYMEQAVDWVLASLAQGDSNKVFMHCLFGLSRSAALAVAVVVAHKTTLWNAYQMVKEKRPSINLSKQLIENLIEFEEKKTGKTSLAISVILDKQVERFEVVPVSGNKRKADTKPQLGFGSEGMAWGMGRGHTQDDDVEPEKKKKSGALKFKQPQAPAGPVRVASKGNTPWSSRNPAAKDKFCQ
eukprot:TRINITY_DN5777_c1_g1_i1.p1 TRINITY_DN5777_c1_g1~~TRINITY_DN5777_c1_g1_i1.p1  ORF type:complete len:284 (-),score=101.62 TRINITY_DN5777_c1_g1_i1:14-766(-)